MSLFSGFSGLYSGFSGLGSNSGLYSGSTGLGVQDNSGAVFTPIQILIPAFGFVNEVSPARQFLIPAFGFINSTGKV